MSGQRKLPASLSTLLLLLSLEGLHLFYLPKCGAPLPLCVFLLCTSPGLGKILP